MKKPTSLYLNELLANRVARHLERALDGHGSLGGFFGWVAEQAQAALLEGGHKLSHCYEAQKAQVRWLKALEGTSPDMEEYRAAWEAFAAYLPWHETHPAASHVLALFALKQASPLWNRPRGQLEHNFRDAVEDQLGRNLLDEFVWATKEPSAKDTAAWDEKRRQVYLLWHRDRLEILGERPRPQAISVYVEPEAHGALLRAFQNTFFDRLLGTLDDLLAGPWPSAGALLAFLERPEGFFHEPALEAKGIHLLVSEYDLETLTWIEERLERCRVPGSDDSARRIVRATPEGEEKEVDLSELPPSAQAYYRIGLDEYRLDWQALGELLRRFGKEWVLKVLENAEWTGRISGDLASVSHSAWLALELGLLDSPFQDGAELRARAIGHLVARYGLSEFRPERRLAYRLLRERIPGERVRDPLEFHALRLLQAYALAVLPEEEREPSRVSQPMLGLLGQAGLFPVRDALELWTGLRVRVDGPEHWRLYKGRKLWRTLSSAEAGQIASSLGSLLPLAHDLVVDAPGIIYEGLGGREFPLYRGIPRLLEPDEVRAVYPLGPEVLELVLASNKSCATWEERMASLRQLVEGLRQQGRFQGAVQEA